MPIAEVVRSTALLVAMFAESAALSAPALRTTSRALWLHEIKHDGFRVIARKDRRPPTHPGPICAGG